MRSESILACLLLPALASSATADTIYLVNGKSKKDIKIVNEGLKSVTYKDGNDQGEVDADDILSIEFSKMPELVDIAESRLVDDGYFEAIADLEQYVQQSEGKEQRLYPWAPAYAMHRLVELNGIVGELAEVVKAADRLIQKAPESRYVPFAYMAKAEALYDLGKSDDARSLLGAFGGVVDSKQLSDRWRIQGDLFAVLLDDSLQGKARRDKLDEIVARAGTKYPVVRNRADAAVGESFLGEKKLKEAEEVFRSITNDPKADSRTLAAAFTGLGDCLFQRGVDENSSGADGSETLSEALKAYLRVVVVYETELRYVPKAMFFAGRVFQQWNDAENQGRAQQLYNAVMRDFGGSKWADEARGFRR